MSAGELPVTHGSQYTTVLIELGTGAHFFVNLADEPPPRLTSGLDVRSLPLSPEQAFVLSRVDGSATVSGIAASTGLPEERVAAALERLHELGAISYGGSSKPPERKSSEPPRRSSSVRLRAVVEEPAPRMAIHPAAATYDLSELDEEVDLKLDVKRQVLDTYYRLGQLTHYQVLGVEEAADKAAIKAAYCGLVGTFHTDRYYGKNLGTFKNKLEKVFGALTKAYDTLSRKRSRTDYDRYLAARRRTAGMVDSHPPPAASRGSGKTVREATAAVPLAQRGSSPEISTDATEQAAAHGARATPKPPPVEDTSPRDSEPDATRPSRSPDPGAAKKAFARRLSGNRPSTIPPPPPPEILDEEQRKQAVLQELKSRYDERLLRTRDERVEKYRSIAQAALDGGDFVNAINALKVALSLVPEDAALAAFLDQTQERADAALADQFLEQGRYEEQDSQLERASRSYERAARGKKSALLYDKAATCLIDAPGDARRAVELARRAVALDGNRVAYRITLARAYDLARMPTSAIAELKRAQELHPGDPNLKAWIKRLK